MLPLLFSIPACSLPVDNAPVDLPYGLVDTGGDTQSLQDSAMVVKHTMPSEMSCGEEVAVTLTMANNGTSVWTRGEGFKLGTVDDEDPFVEATRVYLDEGDEVVRGGAANFEFTLVAPASDGAFRTDWQMVREGVHWFGEPLVHDITVVCSDPDPDPDPAVPPPLDELVWLHSDISSWPQTATLSSVSVSSDQICLPNDGVHAWPIHNLDGTDVVGNPWIVLEHEGTWYAATWEWLRPGQECKAKTSVNGDHIKQPPLDTWSPTSGETYWFMVSGLARFGERNVEARTNRVPAGWP